MLTFEAIVHIQAPPEVVWQYLINAQEFSEWDPDVTRIEGRIALNERITVYTLVSPDRAFPVTVSEFVPARRMVWSSGMPLGLFKGKRTFTLIPEPNGVTHYQVQEVFSGLLLPIIRRTIPDLNEAFQRHATALKAVSEGTVN